MTRLDAVAAALRRDPEDLDAWVEVAAAAARQGRSGGELADLLADPAARAGAARALARDPEARALATLLLGSRGLRPRPGAGYHPTSGMPLVAVGLGPARTRFAWVPGPGAGTYLGERPVRVVEYRKYRPAACPEPPHWARQRELPNRPVLFVTWEQAVVFAAAQGARLPRVEERMWAACGGAPRPRRAPGPPGDFTPMENPPAAPSDWHQALRDAQAGKPGPFGHRGTRANVQDWCLDAGELAGLPDALGRVVVGGDWTRGDLVFEDQDLVEVVDQREGTSTVGVRLAMDVLDGDGRATR